LYSHPSIDGEEPPDNVDIKHTEHDGVNVIVEAETSHGSTPELNVSIGRTDELEDQSDWPVAMSHIGGNLHRAVFAAPASVIDGKQVLVSSSHGGSDNDIGSA
jgi:hypothetical protein